MALVGTNWVDCTYLDIFFEEANFQYLYPDEHNIINFGFLPKVACSESQPHFIEQFQYQSKFDVTFVPFPTAQLVFTKAEIPLVDEELKYLYSEFYNDLNIAPAVLSPLEWYQNWELPLLIDDSSYLLTDITQVINFGTAEVPTLTFPDSTNLSTWSEMFIVYIFDY